MFGPQVEYAEGLDLESCLSLPSYWLKLCCAWCASRIHAERCMQGLRLRTQSGRFQELVYAGGLRRVLTSESGAPPTRRVLGQCLLPGIPTMSQSTPMASMASRADPRLLWKRSNIESVASSPGPIRRSRRCAASSKATVTWA